ncbi:MAG: hypothetical protein AB1779_06620, partial [Candidatus Thermoplasmatota archaeon]
MKENGRIGFACIAVLILLLSVINLWYVGSLNNDISFSKNEETIKIKEIEADIQSQALFIASEVLSSYASYPYNISLINEEINKRFDDYLNESGIKVKKKVIYVSVEKWDLLDIVKSENISENGRIEEISINAYIRVKGYVEIGYGKTKQLSVGAQGGRSKRIEFDKEIDTPYPFIFSLFDSIEEASKDEFGEIGRIVRYMLYNLGQLRIANGIRNADEVINEEDVIKALNIAIFLEEARYFRKYDKNTAHSLGIDNFLEKFLVKGKIDPSELFLIYSDIKKIELSNLINQYIFGLIDYYILFFKDYIGILAGISSFLDKLAKKIEINWSNGSAFVRFWKYISNTWYKNLNIIIENIILKTVHNIVNYTLSSYHISKTLPLNLNPNDDICAFENGIESLINSLEEDREINYDFDNNSIEELIKHFREAPNYLVINSKPSWVPRWIVDGINWSLSILAKALHNIIGKIIENAFHIFSIASKQISKTIFSALKIFIKNSLYSLFDIEKQQKFRYSISHLYNNKFVLSNGYGIEERKKEFEFDVRHYNSDRYDIKINREGLHNTNIKERAGKIIGAIKSLNSSLIFDEIEPYQSIYKISISGFYNLSISHKPKNFYSKVLNSKFKISINITIPLISGLPLSGIKYKPSNTLAGDLFNIAYEAGKLILKGINYIISNVNEICIKLVDFFKFIGKKIFDYIKYDVALLLQIILETPLSKIPKALFNYFCWKAFFLLGSYLNKILIWKTSFFGMNITLSFNVFIRVLELKIENSFFYFSICIREFHRGSMIKNILNSTIREDFLNYTKIQFGIFVKAGIKFGNFSINMLIDPLMVYSLSIFSLDVAYVKNERGWYLNLMIPGYSDTSEYNIWEVSLESLGFGLFNEIHIPTTGLKVNINIGIQL